MFVARSTVSADRIDTSNDDVTIAAI